MILRLLGAADFQLLVVDTVTRLLLVATGLLVVDAASRLLLVAAELFVVDAATRLLLVAAGVVGWLGCMSLTRVSNRERPEQGDIISKGGRKIVISLTVTFNR